MLKFPDLYVPLVATLHIASMITIVPINIYLDSFYINIVFYLSLFGKTDFTTLQC